MTFLLHGPLSVLGSAMCMIMRPAPLPTFSVSLRAVSQSRAGGGVPLSSVTLPKFCTETWLRCATGAGLSSALGSGALSGHGPVRSGVHEELFDGAWLRALHVHIAMDLHRIGQLGGLVRDACRRDKADYVNRLALELRDAPATEVHAAMRRLVKPCAAPPLRFADKR